MKSIIDRLVGEVSHPLTNRDCSLCVSADLINECNSDNSPHAPMTSCFEGGFGGRLTNSKTLLITSSNK